MSLCIKIESAVRRWMGLDKSDGIERTMMFFMGRDDPMEAIYAMNERLPTGVNRQGELPWAVLDAWHVCEESMGAAFPSRSYETRCAWVAKAQEILTDRAAELNAILVQGEAPTK